MFNFPSMYPDELLYSCLARSIVRLGETSFKGFIREIYGKNTVRSCFDLPTNLMKLSKSIGIPDCSNDLLYKNTTFPYYEPFLSSMQAKKIKCSLLNESNCGGTVHTRIGINASKVDAKKYFWMCPKCCEDDKQRYGENYWHRTHQMPGVYVCPIHHTFLEESLIRIRELNQHEFINAAFIKVTKKIDHTSLNPEDIQILTRISDMTAGLMTNPIENISASLHKQYLSLLRDRGYLSPNGRVRRERLYHAFKTRYTDELLNLLQSNVSLSDSNWLSMIFRKQRRTVHPIRHILMMLFLDIDLTSINDIKVEGPFGTAPWLCLNPACKDYKKPVITSMRISRDYKLGVPVGTFYCKCGFVYSRRGPYKNEKDKFRIGRIKEYGHVWKKSLKSLMKEDYSITKIAEILHSDRTTINKYIAQAKNELSDLGKEEIETDYIKRIIEYKSIWLKSQRKNPGLSKTELRKLHPSIYIFLYRHDMDWLEQNSPQSKKVNRGNNRVNWVDRDNELLQDVKKIIREWNVGSDHLIRISKGAIGKKLGKSSLLEHYSDKLPHTINFIGEIVEDVQSFQKRRILHVINELKNEGVPIKEWRVNRRAGIKKSASQEVKEYIKSNTTG